LYFRRPNNFGRPHPWIANTQVPIGTFLILIEKFWLSIEPAICISAKKEIGSRLPFFFGNNKSWRSLFKGTENSRITNSIEF